MNQNAQVAVYVQSKYAKPAYTVESYNVRAWPGLEMICHALRHAGIEVDYCSSATAGRYKVVLVSITSGCDWYPFIAERLTWPKTSRPTDRHCRRRGLAERPPVPPLVRHVLSRSGGNVRRRCGSHGVGGRAIRAPVRDPRGHV